MRLTLWRKVAAAAAIAADRSGADGPSELCANHRSDAHGGGEITALVAQLDMVAEIGDVIAKQSLERFPLGAHLPGSSRIGRHRHVHIRHHEERVRSSAGAELDERVRLRLNSGVIDRFEKSRRAFV